MRARMGLASITDMVQCSVGPQRIAKQIALLPAF